MRSFCLVLARVGFIFSFLFLNLVSVAFAEDIEIDLGGTANSAAKPTPVPADQGKVSDGVQTPAKEAPKKPEVKAAAAKKTYENKGSVVQKVSLSAESDETKILFDGENLSEPSVEKLSKNRLLVKFAKTRLKIPLKIKGDNKSVKMIRSSVHSATAWIVLDLVKAQGASIERTDAGYSLTLNSGEKPLVDTKAPSQDKVSAEADKSSEKNSFSRLIDASIKPVDKGVKIVLTSDGLSKYTLHKLTQPTKLVMRFQNTKLDINEKLKKVKGDDAELEKGGLLLLELRQISAGFSPVSEAILTLLPGTIYQIDRDLNQVVVTLSAPLRVEKPVEKKGNINQLVSLDIEGADINAVVKTLASEAGFDVDFVPGPLSGVVNEKFKDVPLKTALSTLLASGNYDFEMQGNTLRFGAQAALKSSKGMMAHVTEIITPAGGMTPDKLDALVKAILKPTNAITTTVDTTRNVLVLNGTPSDIDDFKRTIRDLKLDEGASGDRITRIAKLNYADPAKLSVLLGVYLTPVGKVQVDNNSLVIWETASNMGVLLELIKELDRKPAQVLIESTIVEVDDENDLNMGVEWDVNRAVGDPTITGSISNPAIPTAGTIAFGTVKNGLNITAEIRALETRKKGKVISRPRIATASGQTAEINEIENVVITTEVDNVSQNGFVTKTFTDTMFPLPISLIVKPRITDDGRITTTILASITAQSGPPSSTGLPPTNVQTATTTITTKNGETIVIGGLVREVSQDTVNGIPLLSSIPILGALFQQKVKNNRKEELIIFITPTLLED